MKSIAKKSEIRNFFTSCYINLNMASIGSTENIQTEIDLAPCVMRHLWYDIFDRNTFLDEQSPARWIGRRSQYIT